MKSSLLSILMFMMIIFIACDKVNDTIIQKDEKPDSRVVTGSVRGYFGNEYKIFSQHIDQVAAIDSFSNCYFYGTDLKQINLIRCDSTYVIAIYINGISPDSFPTVPVPQEFGRFTEIQFYKFKDWNIISADTNNSRYILNDFYGKNVLITKIKDDVLTGRFEGFLKSPGGKVLNVSEGEFQIKIFRKHMVY